MFAKLNPFLKSAVPEPYGLVAEATSSSSRCVKIRSIFCFEMRKLDCKFVNFHDTDITKLVGNHFSFFDNFGLVPFRSGRFLNDFFLKKFLNP